MANVQINYEIAKSVAYRIMATGFGKTGGQMYSTHLFANRIGLDDMISLCAIAKWESAEDNVNFYKVLQQQMYKQFGYLMRKQITEYIPDHFYDFKKDIQVRQLRCAYYALGFAGFYKHMPHDVAKSTLQKWTWKAFANRKDQPRLSKKHRKFIDFVLKTGKIRLSNTTSSIYIENSQYKIRVSDHKMNKYTTDHETIDLSIVIDK